MLTQPLSEIEIDNLKKLLQSDCENDPKSLEEIRELSYRGMITSANSQSLKSYGSKSSDWYAVKYAQSTAYLVLNFGHAQQKTNAINALQKAIDFGKHWNGNVTAFSELLKRVQNQY
ncbi:hypothetical protein [Spirosoma foliorum]|uniref:Uncharacterized protein n=1 Tax=Spirosoma foliorum TaxID=2710596 RepID=A0A7G5GMS0_9BACT|nr:hypothetical protein [Spirosoma foliorum]QMW00162.1 hypothetical protein H3H32_19225 [Spirosoma foliorum]